nr:unnamed protein product [Callosobruchus analis]
MTEASLNFQADSFALYFDGDKDRCIAMQDFRRQTISEERLSLLKEPGSENLLLYSAFQKSKHIDCDKLVGLECDGTDVNTGSKEGVIRCLQLKPGKSLK